MNLSAAHGYETIAIDMPGYGLTQVKQSEKVKYDDWVQAGNDLIEVERQKKIIDQLCYMG